MLIAKELHFRLDLVSPIIFIMCTLAIVACTSNQPAQIIPSMNTAVSTATQTATPEPSLTITPTSTPAPINLNNWNQVQVMGQIGDGEVNDALYSADGNVSVIAFGHAIRFFNKDGTNWKETTRIESRDLLSRATLSSDGSMLAAGLANNKNLGVNIWNAHTGELIHTISEVKSPVRGTAFSRDGKLLIIADDEGVQIWNVNTWTLNRQLTESGFNLEVSPDGKYLAFMNNNISIYDLGQEKDKAIATINGKTDISSYTFRPDSLEIAYATNDGILSFYDLSSFSIIKSWQLKDCGKGSFPSIVYNSDGTLLTAVCQGKLETWNLKTGVVLWEKENSEVYKSFLESGSGTDVLSLAIQTDKNVTVSELDAFTGNSMSARSYDSLPYCFDQFDRGVFIDYLRNNWDGQITPLLTSTIFHEFWSTESAFAVKQTLSSDGKLAAYDLESSSTVNGAIEEEFILRRLEQNSPIIVSRKSETLAIGNKDPYAGISAIAFNSDGSLVTAAFGLHILTWDTEKGKLISDIDVSSYDVGYFIPDVVYTQDGMLIGSGAYGLLFFVDPKTGEWLGSIDSKLTSGAYLALNHDGTKMIQSTCGQSGFSYYDNFVSDCVLTVYGIPSEQ